jgi:hypothetical protein
VAFAWQFLSLRRVIRKKPRGAVLSADPAAERDPFAPLRVSDLPAEDAAEAASGEASSETSETQAAGG